MKWPIRTLVLAAVLAVSSDWSGAWGARYVPRSPRGDDTPPRRRRKRAHTRVREERAEP
jgi:hypothetical protein